MEMYVSVSSLWQYKLFLDIRKRFSDICRQTGVEWGGWSRRICSFPDAISSYDLEGSKVDIVVHYDNSRWISADTNKDDLECPIHLKVRFLFCWPHV